MFCTGPLSPMRVLIQVGLLINGAEVSTLMGIRLSLSAFR